MFFSLHFLISIYTLSDACLSQSTPATKRKFSQRTLLQLNFTLSNSKPKFHNLTHDSNTSPVPPPQHNDSSLLSLSVSFICI